ncbi:MAG: DUF4011 domain-containing protein [Halobacteria archaeon]
MSGEKNGSSDAVDELSYRGSSLKFENFYLDREFISRLDVLSRIQIAANEVEYGDPSMDIYREQDKISHETRAEKAGIAAYNFGEVTGEPLEEYLSKVYQDSLGDGNSSEDGPSFRRLADAVYRIKRIESKVVNAVTNDGRSGGGDFGYDIDTGFLEVDASEQTSCVLSKALNRQIDLDSTPELGSGIRKIPDFYRLLADGSGVAEEIFDVVVDTSRLPELDELIEIPWFNRYLSYEEKRVLESWSENGGSGVASIRCKEKTDLAVLLLASTVREQPIDLELPDSLHSCERSLVCGKDADEYRRILDQTFDVPAGFTDVRENEGRETVYLGKTRVDFIDFEEFVEKSSFERYGLVVFDAVEGTAPLEEEEGWTRVFEGIKDSGTDFLGLADPEGRQPTSLVDVFDVVYRDPETFDAEMETEAVYISGETRDELLDNSRFVESYLSGTETDSLETVFGDDVPETVSELMGLISTKSGSAATDVYSWFDRLSTETLTRRLEFSKIKPSAEKLEEVLDLYVDCDRKGLLIDRRNRGFYTETLRKIYDGEVYDLTERRDGSIDEDRLTEFNDSDQGIALLTISSLKSMNGVPELDSLAVVTPATSDSHLFRETTVIQDLQKSNTEPGDTTKLTWILLVPSPDVTVGPDDGIVQVSINRYLSRMFEPRFEVDSEEARRYLETSFVETDEYLSDNPEYLEKTNVYRDTENCIENCVLNTDSPVDAMLERDHGVSDTSEGERGASAESGNRPGDRGYGMDGSEGSSGSGDGSSGGTDDGSGAGTGNGTSVGTDGVSGSGIDNGPASATDDGTGQGSGVPDHVSSTVDPEKIDEVEYVSTAVGSRFWRDEQITPGRSGDMDNDDVETVGGTEETGDGERGTLVGNSDGNVDGGQEDGVDADSGIAQDGNHDGSSYGEIDGNLDRDDGYTEPTSGEDISGDTDIADNDDGGEVPSQNVSTRRERDDLDRLIDSWKEKLLDLTANNDLVDVRVTKTKSLPLFGKHPGEVLEAVEKDCTLHVRKSSYGETGGRPPAPGELGVDEIGSVRNRDDTEKALDRIVFNGRRFEREKGVDSIYLVLGFLNWKTEGMNPKMVTSPLFLLPVDVTRENTRDPDVHDYVIEYEGGDLILNPALRKKLESEQGVYLPENTEFSASDAFGSFEAVSEAVEGRKEWSMTGKVMLGVFDFTKFVLFTDLEENRRKVKGNAVVNALNGDTSMLPQIDTPETGELDTVTDPVETHRVLEADSSQRQAIEAAKSGLSFVLQGPPGTGKSQTIANIIAEKLAAGENVLFVSEKQAALDVVKQRLEACDVGRFCLEAHGARNKNQILESLESELDAGRLKSPEQERNIRKLREVREELNSYGFTLSYSPEKQETTVSDAFGVLAQVRDQPDIETGIDDVTTVDQETVDDCIENLRTLSNFGEQIESFSSHPWRYTEMDSWKLDTEKRVEESLEKAGESLEDLREAAEETVESVVLEVSEPNDVRNVVEFLEYLQEKPKLELREEHLDRGFYEDPRGRIEDLREADQRLRELEEQILEKYREGFLDRDGDELHSELTSYGVLRYVKPGYRRLKQKILDYTREGYDPGYGEMKEDAVKLASVNRLEDEVDKYEKAQEMLGESYERSDTDWEAVEEMQDWIEGLKDLPYSTQKVMEVVSSIVDDGERVGSHGNEIAGSHGNENTGDKITGGRGVSEFDGSRVVENLESSYESWLEAKRELGSYVDLDETVESDSPGFGEIETVLDDLSGSLDTLRELVEYKQRLREVRDTPAGGFVGRYMERGLDAEEMIDCFLKNFYTEWLNEIYEETGLDSFSRHELECLIEDYVELSSLRMDIASAEIQNEVTKNRPRMDLEHAETSEQVYLKREIKKSRNRDPLRKLFDKASGLVTDLKPCFMMSPLTAAQYLKMGALEFDSVIFDEASQVMPEDAVSSIVRADQVIVAGDSRQLPPTSFFETDAESSSEVRDDLESILDECSAVLPEKQLRWHYRSRTDRLIQFSNERYYDGNLRTFPENGYSDRKGVDFRYVEDGVYDRGGTRRNDREAERVVDVVEEYVEAEESRSIGVVAFNKQQTMAVREKIKERSRENDLLRQFLEQEEDVLEGFFVKSLEDVQGDERDVLVFSVGYGPDEDGSVSMNFGPLNQTGGERRLNVAVTRAREKVEVVSSIKPGEIDLNRTESKGVRDFKDYLRYARRSPDERSLTKSRSADNSSVEDSPDLGEAVADALEERGWSLDRDIEGSGYSVDFGIEDPDDPDRYVIGVECDTSVYRESETASDREKTRPGVMESMGWHLHRVWAPDWLIDPDREVRRIEERIEEAVDNGGVNPDDGTDQEDDDENEFGVREERDLDIVTYRKPGLQINSDGGRNDEDQHVGGSSEAEKEEGNTGEVGGDEDEVDPSEDRLEDAETTETGKDEPGITDEYGTDEPQIVSDEDEEAVDAEFIGSDEDDSNDEAFVDVTDSKNKNRFIEPDGVETTEKRSVSGEERDTDSKNSSVSKRDSIETDESIERGTYSPREDSTEDNDGFSSTGETEDNAVDGEIRESQVNSNNGKPPEDRGNPGDRKIHADLNYDGIDEIDDELLMDELSYMANTHGPIDISVVLDTLRDGFGLSRITKNEKEIIQDVIRDLDRRDELHVKNGVLWPSGPDFDLPVRRQEDDGRSIGEIPVEEIAKASYLLIESGGRMSKDDLILEAARLYGFDRLGSNIEKKIHKSVVLLEKLGCVKVEAGYVEPRDCDVEERILTTVY